MTTDRRSPGVAVDRCTDKKHTEAVRFAGMNASRPLRATSGGDAAMISLCARGPRQTSPRHILDHLIIGDSMRRHAGLICAGLAIVCAAAPLGAQTKQSTAVCKDGTTSSVAARGAACSSHGGVDSVATAAAKKSAKAAKADAKAARAKASKNSQKAATAAALAKKADDKAAKAEEKAAHDSVGATAVCKDGSYSHAASGQSACARHGGVAKTLKR
jgi:hypothetical protein